MIAVFITEMVILFKHVIIIIITIIIIIIIINNNIGRSQGRNVRKVGGLEPL